MQTYKELIKIVVACVSVFAAHLRQLLYAHDWGGGVFFA
jgi:hypothetical protein